MRASGRTTLAAIALVAVPFAAPQFYRSEYVLALGVSFATFAVLSGALAGAAAAQGAGAGAAHRAALRARLGTHLLHSSTASWVSRWPRVMDAAFRAAGDDQRVFDDVVALGLADGRLTPRTLAAAARRLS